MIERFTLDADRATLTYEFTVEDPLSLTEPVTRSFQWAYRPDLEPTGQQCDTGIATRFCATDRCNAGHRAAAYLRRTRCEWEGQHKSGPPKDCSKDVPARDARLDGIRRD